MNFCKTTFFSFLLLMMLHSRTGYCQHWNWDRFEIGGSFLYTGATFAGVTTKLDPWNNFAGDTTVKRGISSMMGYGLYIGTSMPFERIWHETNWAFDIGLFGNQIIWSDINSVYNSSGILKPNSSSVGTINATTTQVGIPVGLEFKEGTDAILTKRHRIGVCFGAGIMGLANITTVNNIKSYDEHGGGINFGLNPYAKAEFVFFYGLCYKIRLMASYGNLNYMFENSNVGKYTDGPMRITGIFNATGMLIVMPFSRRWMEHTWSNTYDTYNKYDKFH